ncbi:uncharacterized protein LOC110942742 [Helianthus annuus]|uniref:uncharacterized protein LOC110942742 n=1 Tax=Helianthus annuus TaxID=4232 RepID=UPI000B8EE9DD|nr:uncharacterized protein LOC110942742 [Helianthus annuus]
MNQVISAVIANGNNISFWLDRWVDPLPFYLQFPDLFKVERDKECMVTDRISAGDDGIVFNWAWTKPDLGLEELNQVQHLIGLIGGLALTSGIDGWCWKYDPSGNFSVASIKRILSSTNRISPERVFEWNNWVSKKVGMVAWRAKMERMPTKHALAIRNVPVLDHLCVLCGDYVETCDHIFVSCHFAQIVWLNIAAWCKLPPIIAFGINDLLTLHGVSSGSRKKRKALHAVVLVTFWCIWKMRNDVVFRQSSPNAMKMLDKIKSMAYLWVNHRSKEAALTWEDWSRFNFGG